MRRTESFGIGSSLCVVNRKAAMLAVRQKSVFSAGIIAVSQITYFCGIDRQFEEYRTIKQEIL